MEEVDLTKVTCIDDLVRTLNGKPESLRKEMLYEVLNANPNLVIDYTIFLENKLNRRRILQWATHKAHDTVNLAERSDLFVKALSDELSEHGNSYKFEFDSVALYIPSSDGDLEAISGRGNYDLKISRDDARAQFMAHLDFGDSRGKETELVLPLVANAEYQGCIIVSNAESGRAISKDHYDFFHAITDAAAGAVYSGKAYNELNRLHLELKDRIPDIVHDAKAPLLTAGTWARRVEKLINMLLIKSNSNTDENPSSQYEPAEIGTRTESIDAQALEGILQRLRIVIKQIDIGQNIIEDILVYSKFEGSYAIEPVNYDLNSRLRKLGDAKQIEAERKNMEFAYILDPSAESILADRYLERVLQNLIGNAIMHGREGSHDKSKIYVETKRDENGIIISVSNQGQIDSSDNIFERGISTKKGEGGNGLGLYIVKTVAEAHKGRVWYENLNLDDKDYVKFNVFIPDCNPTFKKSATFFS